MNNSNTLNVVTPEEKVSACDQRRILRAINKRTALGRPFTVEEINRDVWEMKLLATIGMATRRLFKKGKIRRVARGVYAPVAQNSGDSQVAASVDPSDRRT